MDMSAEQHWNALPSMITVSAGMSTCPFTSGVIKQPALQWRRPQRSRTQPAARAPAAGMAATKLAPQALSWPCQSGVGFLLWSAPSLPAPRAQRAPILPDNPPNRRYTMPAKPSKTKFDKGYSRVSTPRTGQQQKNASIGDATPPPRPQITQDRGQDQRCGRGDCRGRARALDVHPHRGHRGVADVAGLDRRQGGRARPLHHPRGAA